ncbi:ABC transporter [Mangrovactinospora gilvigrisea]|uniref:ABC transporter n=1 Tax=Mangrovactinospora gilvigrisea TaxID=1428644 RepID=A0A1J7BIA5_9ACTN|nr:ATP-binding cassette domain-containing protein [Mangrovactinospora gilvigrisea]OIV38395.1 ABC transporter [Mangrovactinospora gilvigrisea]
MPSTSDGEILARGLVKTYTPRGSAPVRALDGLDLSVAPGTVLGLLGPNGAGKSTTVKILTTLARPDAGRAVVAGNDVARRPDAVRRAIGVVAQRSGVDPVATGRENLVLQARLHGLSGRDARARADALLERFLLTEAAGRRADTYSGGMQRRLDVALGLVHRPRILFLDEPTTGLDPEARAAMWAEISRLAREEGVTVLLTTHYLEEADRLAGGGGRIAVVDRGKVVAEGTPDELKGALRGDAVHLELGPSADLREACRVVAAVPGTREVRGVGSRGVSARADDGAAAVPAVLAALQAAGAPAASVTVARPSLDDVYLRVTGRRYAAEAAEDETPAEQHHEEVAV